MLTFGFADTQPSAPPPPPEPDEGDANDAPQSESLNELAAVEEEMEQDDQPSVGEEVNATLMSLLPWGISIIFHAGLVLLAVFIVWSTVTSVDEEEVIVPVIRLSQTPGAPLQMKTTQRVQRTSSAARRSVSRSTATSTALRSTVDTRNTLIGVTGGSAGKASPFGTDVAGAGQFKTSFFGAGGNARRIVFLVDASGSLIAELPFVILELKKTIQQLSEKQSFTIIFFQGDSVIEVPPRGLKKADAQTKQRVTDWIDTSNHNIVAVGKSSPIKALRTALRYKPQLLYLLSDNITGEGRYEVDQRRLLREIEEANKSNTKINTIQFLYHDPLTEFGLKGTLELISNRSGGVHRFVPESELGIQ